MESEPKQTGSIVKTMSPIRQPEFKAGSVPQGVAFSKAVSTTPAVQQEKESKCEN